MESGFLEVKLSRRGSWVAALVLFALAFGFRLAGIGWGLPNELRNQTLHPDEQLIYLVGTQTPYLQPGFYNYGTFYFTAIHVANDVGTSYGWIPKFGDSPDGDVISAGVKSGRVISALAGAATVSLVFAALLLVTGTLGSFIGAVAMLLAPGHVVHSRFQTTDVFATMLIALAGYLIIRMLQSENKPVWKSLLAIGVVIGLAAGTKYTGILLLLPAIYGLWKLKVAAKDYGVVLASTIGGFLVATPGALLQSDAFMRGFMFEVAHSAEGHGLVFIDTPPGIVYHILNMSEAIGMAPLLFGIAGLTWAIVSKKSWAIASALFVVAYFAVIAGAEVKFLRYVFPLLPFIAIGVGYIAGRCHEERGWKRVVTGATILLIGFTAATTSGAFALTRLMTTQDPRDQAANWFAKETPNEATIGLVSDPWFYTPPFAPNFGMLSPDERIAALADNPRVLRYILEQGDKLDWDVRLLQLKPEYIVFSSFEYLDHDRLSEPNFVAFMDAMRADYEFIGIFWGDEPAFATDPESTDFDRHLLRVVMRERYPKTHDMMYIRPTICVFRLKKTN